mgnify:CR=1 FL=1
MIFGGKANGMKHKFSSVSNDTSAKRSHRGVGQAVAALVMALALTIGGAGTTILLVEQNAQAALSVADRGYVLETGKIVTSGTGAELLASPEIKRAYLGG